MRFKTLAGRLTLSLCSIGTAGLFAEAEVAFAETLPTSTISLSSAESSQFDARRSEIGLSAIAENINTDVEVNRQLAEEAEKAGTLDFADLPLIGSLIESGGKVSTGGNVPLSFSVGSVLGSYGVVMNADF